jgi:hypothetical protein
MEEKPSIRITKFALTIGCRVAFSLVLNVILLAESAFADIRQDVGRIFELNAKIQPGMTIEAVNELLGPPAERHVMKGSAAVRYMWLHGEMGIEIYEMDDAAYQVNITLPCGSAKETSRAMDALTRQGNSKYGSMPRFDSRLGQYYWVRNGVKFSFSKYNQTTVLSSCTNMR